MRTNHIAFRATEQEKTKLERLARQTGLSASEVLRALLASAELEPVRKLEPVAQLGREATVQQ